MSLSARRAWIEIAAKSAEEAKASVALRKESVDRNASARLILTSALVALRKESVDRNDNEEARAAFEARRSPQGERG